ncbi:MAG: hypothetical protein IM466_11275 [Microcystis sp. M04BS1]|nr:hypothetical protein [Microcystis sp. M04BS1]
MSIKQLSLFENVPPEQDTKAVTTSEEISELEITILLSALIANAIAQTDSTLISALADDPRAIAIARTFDRPKLVRQLRLSQPQKESEFIKLTFQGNQVFYREREIGKIQLVYKSPSPGELQAKLTHESTIDRFLEFLQKKYQIVSLHESNYHVQIFIPQTQQSHNIEDLWLEFITKVIFSIYGDFQYQLSGLRQNFITMLKSVTLSGRGFSTLEIPIITRDQAKVLAALYLAIFEQVNDRQEKRERESVQLIEKIKSEELNSKDLESTEKKLKSKQEMQAKEFKKYRDYFQKVLSKLLDEQRSIYHEIRTLDEQLKKTGLSKAQVSKLQKQKDKIESQIIFQEDLIEEKQRFLEESDGNPFEFLNKQKQTNLLKPIQVIAKSFNKTATEQINSTRGDIFTQCILEMYRLLENPKLETIPEPLLTIGPKTLAARTAGDDGKDFCYSCGVTLDAKTARWRVARFMFERPSQRRQSSSSEDRPFICSSCSVLSFASPLKVTDDSIILRLESQDDRGVTKVKIKDYLRMLTNKEVHLSSGCYIALTSEKTITGDTASKKLGQFQYALAKVASIFPLEVIKDFKFVLQLQRTEKVLASRQLIFIKGLIEGYDQSIIVNGKDINLKLGDAIRYVQQDSPYLADYTLLKASSISDRLLLERVREQYLQTIIQDIQGETMTIDSLWKRAKLYEDVAALTGLTYAFAQSLESTAKKLMKPEDAEREVSKLIEKVDDPVAFSYYATLGDEKKISVQARLYHNPDNYFIYEQAKKMLENKLEITDREEVDNSGKKWLVFYADDITKSYAYFANPDQVGNYAQEKEWKNLTYNLKLSLYTRFPELVRKLSSKGDK